MSAADGTRSVSVVSSCLLMSSGRAVSRCFMVVVLVSLFGGLFAVFASSARADNHQFLTARSCDHFTVNLSNYDNPSENPAPNRISITIDDVAVVDAVEFADEYSYSMDLDPNVEKEILVEVFDPEDPTGSEGWTSSRSYSIPACEEPATTTTAAPTSIADDTTVACDGIEVVLNTRGENPPLIQVTINVFMGDDPDDGVVVTEEFTGSYFRSVSLDPNVEKTIWVGVVELENSDRQKTLFTRTWISPVCEEQITTSTAPTTTSAAVGVSTLAFTSAEFVSSALLGLFFLESGALILLFSRRAED